MRKVTVITCTKRPGQLRNLFSNFARQSYKNKELIVILHHRDLRRSDYEAAAALYGNARIYRLPEKATLGSCLNYGVRMSDSPYIAKFDDDDYYSPHYLAESMRIMERTKADIVGKRAHFMYLNGKKTLLLRYSRMENRFVRLVQGATLLARRRVFAKVTFPDRTRGECVRFCADSAAKGFKIYAGSRYNFAAVRQPGSKGHTWIVSDKKLLARRAKAIKAADFKTAVTREVR